MMARRFQLVGQGQDEKNRDRGEQVKNKGQTVHFGGFIMSLDKLINCASNAVAVTTHYYCKPVPVCSLAVVDSGPYISTGFGLQREAGVCRDLFPTAGETRNPIRW